MIEKFLYVTQLFILSWGQRSEVASASFFWWHWSGISRFLLHFLWTDTKVLIETNWCFNPELCMCRHANWNICGIYERIVQRAEEKWKPQMQPCTDKSRHRQVRRKTLTAISSAPHLFLNPLEELRSPRTPTQFTVVTFIVLTTSAATVCCTVRPPRCFLCRLICCRAHQYA